MKSLMLAVAISTTAFAWQTASATTSNSSKVTYSLEELKKMIDAKKHPPHKISEMHEETYWVTIKYCEDKERLIVNALPNGIVSKTSTAYSRQTIVWLKDKAVMSTCIPFRNGNARGIAHGISTYKYY